jgi:uncharacterized protein
LEQFEHRTKHQLVVVTVTSLRGRDVADFTRELANSWGIGRKCYDDGIVLLVAPHERKVRIAVGYGLEKALPNEVAQRIIDQRILPQFRRGEYRGVSKRALRRSFPPRASVSFPPIADIQRRHKL